MNLHNLLASVQTWGCFLMGLIFSAIACMSEGGTQAGTFDRFLLITGSLLMFAGYCAAFARDAQAGVPGNAGRYARERSEPAAHLMNMASGQIRDR